MKRWQRIALEIASAPTFALLLLGVSLAPDLIAEIGYGHVNGAELLGIFFGVAAFVGAPSIVYASAMELGFSQWMHPSSWKAVGFSTLIGVCVGALTGAISHFLASNHDGDWRLLFLATLFWGISGFVSGLLVKVLSRTMSAQSHR